MAKIPTQKLLRIEDYPDDQKSWLGTLFGVLNSFLTTVSNALSSQLTFGDNIQGQEYILDFIYQTPSDFPAVFRNTLPVQPKAVALVSATEQALPVILLFSWQLTSDGKIQIADIVKATSAGITTLVAGARYRVIFRTMP